MPVTIDLLAEADVDEIRQWYENRRPELGDEFLLSVQEALVDIQRLPLGYPVLVEDVRAIVLRRFPYNVCYRVLADRITVIAVYHAKRDPTNWLDRI